VVEYWVVFNLGKSCNLVIAANRHVEGFGNGVVQVAVHSQRGTQHQGVGEGVGNHGMVNINAHDYGIASLHVLNAEVFQPNLNGLVLA